MNTATLTKNSVIIDRQKVSPFLLRIFLSEERHFLISEYTNRKTPPPSNELQIYTWLDATLNELTGLIRENPKFQAKGTQFSFNIVFPEPNNSNYRMRHVGVAVGGGKRSTNDEITLSQCRYQIGDYLDVAILPPGVDISHLNNQPRRNRNRNRGRGGGAGGGDAGDDFHRGNRRHR